MMISCRLTDANALCVILDDLADQYVPTGEARRDLTAGRLSRSFLPSKIGSYFERLLSYFAEGSVCGR